jgi:NADPH:quinone reductase-like Zn-dependent oxidoreductase
MIYGICSAKNTDYVRQIGASQAIDYGSLSFDISKIVPARSVDLIVDCVSGISGGPTYVAKGMELLKPSGRYVALNSTSSLDWIRSYLTDTCGCNVQRSRYDLFSVNQSRPGRDLAALANMMQQKNLKPFISREIPLAESPLRRGLHAIKQGHTRGKMRVFPEQNLPAV